MFEKYSPNVFLSEIVFMLAKKRKSMGTLAFSQLHRPKNPATIDKLSSGGSNCTVKNNFSAQVSYLFPTFCVQLKNELVSCFSLDKIHSAPHFFFLCVYYPSSLLQNIHSLYIILVSLWNRC